MHFNPAPMTFNEIPLDRLDIARSMLNAMLKHRGKLDNKRYGTRTFFLGPRPKRTRYRPASTLKSAAYAAKIGVYEMYFDRYSNRWVPVTLLYYI
jgi:hypothetical protein